MNNIDQTIPYQLDKPEFLHVRNLHYVDCEALIHPGHISVKSKQGTPTIFSDVDIKLPLDKKEITRLRHEFVSSENTIKTDVKMSQIDPNYQVENHEVYHNLSPDFWLPERRYMGELSTSGTDSEDFMEKNYKSKKIKYEVYMEKFSIERYYIFIVGPTKILTNCSLPQEVVDELCARNRFCLQMEAQLTDSLGWSFFEGDETNLNEDLVLSVFKSIQMIDIPSTQVFNFERILSTLTPINESEENEAMGILKAVWDSTHTLSKSSSDDLKTYLSKFLPQATRHPNELKRVCNFPFVLPTRTDRASSSVESMPLSLIGIEYSQASLENMDSCYN